MKALGVKIKQPKLTAATSEESDDKEQFPCLRFNGKQAAIVDLSKCRYGEEYEMTIRVKATSIGGSNYPGSGNDEEHPAVEFDVIAASEPEEIESEAEDEGDDEEYEKPKTKIERGPKDAGMM